MKKIGCFHAHHSNIELVEQAFAEDDVEWVHVVDPGPGRMKTELGSEILRRKINDTLDWIAKCRVDAILVTCTYFTSQLRDEDLRLCPVPVVKIDEPLFGQICRLNRPLTLLFTNPATVRATMEQLQLFSQNRGKEIQAKSVLLDDTFELLMGGRKTEYLNKVTNGLHQVLSDYPDQTVFAAQLSMAPAAIRVQAECNVMIGNHLDSLAAFMREMLDIPSKQDKLPFSNKETMW